MTAALLTPQPARHSSPTVRATALAYLVFDRPDLGLAERFLTDFGLVPVERTADQLVLRGTSGSGACYRVHRGPTARFRGFGLEVLTAAEVERLLAVPGARRARGGRTGAEDGVCLTDPSGLTVEVVAERPPQDELPRRAPLHANLTGSTPRVDDTQRPPVAPAEVIKLGHVVLEVADFQATCGWYTQHFGFVPSDVQVLPDGSPAVCFLRLDLGVRPADHHTLAIAQGFAPGFGHAAFEVVDADAIGMGHRVLRERGWRHAWGLGRHLLGSQIFDYWEDPWGAKHEHYCDGDVFTADVPLGVHAVSRDAMAQWGQIMPASFTRPRLTLANLVALVRNLRRSPDLSVRKLITLARLFG